jgi:hypothetical protein
LAVLAVGLLVLSTPSAAAAEESHAESRAAIVQVIQEQMEAFKRDDHDAAFSLASPAIQRQFGTPERFIRMVIAGYMPVFRPRSVLFLDLVEDAGRPIQRVIVEGPDGEAVLALYPMVRLADGRWRIDGCVLLGQSGKGI